MRKPLISLLLFLLSASLWAQQERIYTFRSNIRIDTSGVIFVREDIRIYAAGNVFKRGITRLLPLRRKDADGKEVEVGYNVRQVYKDDLPVNFFTERQNGELKIYAGEKNVFLSPGFYTYSIVYDTPGQIGFFKEYDELSWNANGETDTPIDTVSATLHFPPTAKIIGYTCYCGTKGSNDSACTSEKIDEQTLRTEATQLNSHEMLTISAAINKGVISSNALDSYKPNPPSNFFDRMGLVIFTALLLVFLLPYYFYTWLKHGKDHPSPIVIPLYDPPADMSPAAMAMLYKERFDNDHITASIVNLAVKGYLKIKETEEQTGIFGLRRDRIFKITKLKDGDEILPEEEQGIMQGLFFKSNEVTINGKYSKDIDNLMVSFKDKLNRKYQPILSEGHNTAFNLLPQTLISLYLLSLYYFAEFEPDHYLPTLIKTTIPLLFVFSFVYRLIHRNDSVAKNDWIVKVGGGSLAIAALLLMLANHQLHWSSNALAFGLGFPIIMLAQIVYSNAIRQPGKRKLQLQSQIKGLKMFIDYAEEKRLQVFNPPKVTPEVFEALLPYAIALNMGKIWGQKFQNSISTAATAPGSYAPTWYSGAYYEAASFAETLNNAFSNTFNHSATEPSSESGGNWSSGSFGGGSAGSGGGGGSAGGW